MALPKKLKSRGRPCVGSHLFPHCPAPHKQDWFMCEACQKTHLPLNRVLFGYHYILCSAGQNLKQLHEMSREVRKIPVSRFACVLGWWHMFVFKSDFDRDFVLNSEFNQRLPFSHKVRTPEDVLTAEGLAHYQKSGGFDFELVRTYHKAFPKCIPPYFEKEASSFFQQIKKLDTTSNISDYILEVGKRKGWNEDKLSRDIHKLLQDNHESINVETKATPALLAHELPQQSSSSLASPPVTISPPVTTSPPVTISQPTMNSPQTVNSPQTRNSPQTPHSVQNLNLPPFMHMAQNKKQTRPKSFTTPPEVSTNVRYLSQQRKRVRDHEVDAGRQPSDMSQKRHREDNNRDNGQNIPGDYEMAKQLTLMRYSLESDLGSKSNEKESRSPTFRDETCSSTGSMSDYEEGAVDTRPPFMATKTDDAEINSLSRMFAHGAYRTYPSSPHRDRHREIHEMRVDEFCSNTQQSQHMNGCLQSLSGIETLLPSRTSVQCLRDSYSCSCSQLHRDSSRRRTQRMSCPICQTSLVDNSQMKPHISGHFNDLMGQMWDLKKFFEQH